MLERITLVGAMLTGLALGSGTWFLLRSPPPTSPEAADSMTNIPVQSHPLTGYCEGDLTDVRNSLAELKQELTVAQAGLKVAQAQLHQETGDPIPWPSQVPSLLQEATFRTHAETAASQVNQGFLTQLDCSEYPCIAVINWKEEGIGQLKMEGDRLVRDGENPTTAILAGPYGELENHSSWSSGAGKDTDILVFSDPKINESVGGREKVHHRIYYRIDQIRKERLEAWKAERDRP